MSFVGPRPTSFAPATYSAWHTERLEVRPGITGLWQIQGRNRTTFDERLRLDIQYVRHMSLGLDLRIICRTVVAIFSVPGA
jgi:lipopolysaccharide/colanic/teichoic acid biosynthesis glycosyltransferase